MRRVKLAAAAFCCSVFVVSLWGFDRTVPSHVEGTFAGPPPTPYIRFSPGRSSLSAPAGSALVVHGLNSNKEFMQMMAMGLADGGFETWVIDLPGHGDSPTRFSSEASQRAIEMALDSLPAGTILIGHSLGAGLLADLAASRHLETVILLSPPPIRIAKLDIARLFVVSGRFDAPRINASVPALIEAAGGTGEWRRLPWAAHSTALYKPQHIRMIVEWAGGSGSEVRAPERLGWLALLIAAALIGPAATVGIYQRRAGSMPKEPSPASSATPFAKRDSTRNGVALREIIGWTGSLSVSLVLLAFVNPLWWLRVFRTDYLVGLILIAGLIMWRGQRAKLSRGGAMVGILSAAYIVVAIWLIGSSIMHVVPSGEQWLRIPVLAAASFPLFLHDEQTIRLYPSWWRKWGTFLLTRLLIWAAVVTGVLLLRPEAAFLVLITHFVVLAWFPLWWLAGLVAKATGEPAAAALFSSLVQGWVFAALFVTI